MSLNRHQRRALKAANRTGRVKALAPVVRSCLMDGCPEPGESLWMTPAGAKGALCREHAAMLDEARQTLAIEAEQQRAAEALRRLPAWRVWLLALWLRFLNFLGVGPARARLGPSSLPTEPARPLSSEVR